jgi:serine/threonine protein kinase
MDHVSGILPFTLRLHTEPRPGPGLFAGLLDGLAAVHEAGLVHGSLWPDNVLGASHGAVILDVAVRNAAEGLIRRMSRRIARVGWQRPGRFAAARFLSPEQARGEEPTPASDVWTAGVLLAETLSGQPILPPEEGPFNLMRVATGKVGVPPALRSGPFAGILGRALASRPVDRFPHGRAFATAFGRIDPAFWTVALNP